MSSLTQADGLPGDWKTAWPWSDEGIIGPAVRVSTDMISWAINAMPQLLRESPWLSGACVLTLILTAEAIRRYRARSPQARQQLVQNTLDALPDAVALFNADGRLTAVNRKLSGLMPLGIEPAQFPDIGTTELYAQISPDNEAVARAHQRALDSAPGLDSTLTFELPSYGRRSLLIRERNTSDGGKSISVYGSNHLINQRLEDPLTCLANRTRLVHELSRLCSRTRSQLSLIIVDLRSFRQINDTYGRCAGDELLRQTACCLQQAMPADALIARTAGDEFAILLEADHDHGTIEATLAELLQTLRSGLNVNAMNVPVRASIGIAYAPEHGNTVSTLLKSADSACAHAKYLKGNSIVVYNSAQQQQAKRRHQLEIGLQQAIERDELALQYQPQIDIRSKMTCGMEALLRWHSSEFGRVPPDDFIPVAEETGIIHRLGEWVLNRAVADYQRLSHYGMSPSMLSVNLSRKQFEGSHIVPQIDRLLSQTGFDPDRLCLEITETALARDTQRLQRQLLELTSMGVHLAIDDFGVGYSSLLELRDYPISEVKIDRAFVANIASDAHSQDIVAAIVDISRSIGAEVVAEGIENQQQFDMVDQLGCDRAQGYFLCEPMAATTFPDVVLGH
ncbi:putative bifunctional diguanylate cyclase/phosphodiesterase [Granulosicoccus sp. 3-233]|uniref:putative bifunctional diguanylate cyclase/phosphodiesterase n=1 Tax=Granulosicoccus sp. 3-233 TaxID=3417969 RepID=UPI003D34D3B0